MFEKSKFTIFIAIILILFSACENKDNKKFIPKPVEVGFITLDKVQFALEQELSGRVKPKFISEVRPQITGIVQEQLFKEGSFVKKGDILYKIDKSTYQMEFNQAQASLNSAKANLISIEAKLKRVEELIKFDGASKQELDDTKASYLQAKALVEEKLANFENTKINLQRCEIKAPISGYIGISTITSGALVLANQSDYLTTIKDSSKVFVDLNQSYNDILKLKKVLPTNDFRNTFVTLILDDNTIYSKKGILESKELAVDENTGTVTLRAEFENEDNILLSGMYVKAIIETSSKVDSFLVPQQAVLRDQKANPIITILDKDDGIKTKIIEIQRAIGNKWLVTSGVNENDKIIIEGLNKINDKSKVIPKDLTDKYKD
ncbi:efflux RND transporter periplasmic adaptor subunit [Aliarcobacter lanthieri]|uniref:efflux RND transporter periplasmic adaptor subunit n=1 Tax=Aliarcobacter lanthieri TaxID=1355374 RepID=UPI00047C2D8D|nr:efflux RND transporter periplasmic adaptor subunit [Aliarcobacter lanthieri]QKF60259.1 RND family efflux system, membrane fusion protein [Aliarcobacter lanthieri]